MFVRAAFFVVLAGLLIAACAREGRGVKTVSIGAVSSNIEIVEKLELTALAWLAPDADAVAFFSQEPAECLAPAKNYDERYLIGLGRTAFNSPLLFGGPAARGGLSCNSCHRGGRDNPTFFLGGLSDGPGTADVTSALLSKSRGDGVFNPLPIPDLVGIGKNTTFGTAAPAPSLHAFIENAIIDEFQGAPPPAAIVAGLTFYVQRFNQADCTSDSDAITLTRDTARVREMLWLAREALKKDDASTADFLVLSAQNKLGHVHERFAGESLVEARADLISLSRNLAVIRTVLRNAPEAASEQLGVVLPALDALQESLAQQEVFSFYNKGQLAKAAGLAPEMPAP